MRVFPKVPRQALRSSNAGGEADSGATQAETPERGSTADNCQRRTDTSSASPSPFASAAPTAAAGSHHTKYPSNHNSQPGPPQPRDPSQINHVMGTSERGDSSGQRPGQESPVVAVRRAMVAVARQAASDAGPAQCCTFTYRPRPFALIAQATPRPLRRVEGVFADFTKKRPRRGAFVSVDALVAAIIKYPSIATRSRGHSSGPPPWRASW